MDTLEPAPSLSTEVACPGCDLLVRIDDMRAGETAKCPRCGCLLSEFRANAFEQVIAFAVAGLILLGLANSYAFLTMSSNGMDRRITLWQAPAALWDYGMPLVAGMVAAFIIAVPALVLLLLLAVCIPLRAGRYQSWLETAAKGVFLSHHWAMVEVFIIGVIVSLVKISELATIDLGISFWAYAAFSGCFIMAVSSLDRVQCWETIERLSQP
ncbi:MAG: paraquat-inducible protein A [Halioglobus sp.]|nr:paraquat-inducible protein A [Halioglobus sp.]